MNKSRILSGASLAILSLCAVSSSAEARERFNGLNTAQLQTINNLNTHRTQIETRVSSAASNGQISAQQANDLRAVLSQSSLQQSQFLSDNILTLQETQSMMAALASADSSLQTSINSFAASQASNNWLPASNVALPASSQSPWFRGSQYNSNNRYANWRQAQLQEILNLQNNLASKLETGRTNRRLDSREYATLKAEFDRLNTRIQRMSASAGNLNRGESTSIANSLYKLEDKINKELRDRDFASRNGRRSW